MNNYRTLEDAEKALATIQHHQPQLDYETWLKLVSACADEFGESTGAKLMLKYYPNLKPNETELKAKHRLPNVHIATLFHIAKQYGYTSGNTSNYVEHYSAPRPIPMQPKNPIDTIPLAKIENCLDDKHHEKNNFIQFLRTKFGNQKTDELIAKYYIGTSKKWAGATAFLQIDTSGKIRQMKAMLYDATTGKRFKGLDAKGKEYTTFLGKSITDNYTANFVQCCFGEHLIVEDGKTIAVVESEKTAIIASLYFPNYVWIATGNKGNLGTLQRCEALRGRKVVLFPDLKKTEREGSWSEKLPELRSIGINASCSTYLERSATPEQKQSGLDIADFLLNIDFHQWTQQSEQEPSESPKLADENSKAADAPVSTDSIEQEKEVKVLYSEIKELLEQKQPPLHAIELNSYTIATDLWHFIDYQYHFALATLGTKNFAKPLERLQELREYLIKYKK